MVPVVLFEMGFRDFFIGVDTDHVDQHTAEDDECRSEEVIPSERLPEV